ncbi:MAG: GDP-mannose 4,6-dehydratase [Thermoleophilia bacterium]|nr:GDP-mannose 4,6-dehydratase [Thermoleophilia bacterium]
MKTLVTGGAGFIGSHLVDALTGRGDEVVVLDNLSSGKLENLAPATAAGARLVEGDIRDTEFVRGTLEAERPGTIFHLAGQSEVRKSIDEPTYDATVNVVGSVNLIEASQQIGLDRFVFASTGGAVYGEGEHIDLPAVETTVPEPMCQYGLSKFVVEKYLELYRRLYMFNSVALRLGNVYGPRQNPKGEAGAVAIFAGQLLRGETPTVFGDGTQTRDFVYVADVIDAMLTASRTDVEGTINIGSGKETPLLDLISTIGGLGENGTSFEPEFDTPRKGDVQRNAIDPSRAAADLGWSATTSLEDGLRKTVDSI